MRLVRHIGLVIFFFVQFSSYGQKFDYKNEFELFIEAVSSGQSIDLTSNQKEKLRTYVRKEPEYFVSLFSKNLDIESINQIKVKNYLYSLLTIAHYNLGDLKKASFYNQKELESFKDYNYNLSDSLRAFSNKTILFYSLDQPTDALKSAVTLHERLVDFEFNADVVKLYKQLATIYSLLQFDQEAFDVLEFVIDKAKSSGKEEYLGEVYVTIAYYHLSQGKLDFAENYLIKSKEYIKTKPYLKRRILGGYAKLYQLKGEFEKANKYYKSAFNAFLEYPDVISMAWIIKDYIFFLREYPAYTDIIFLEKTFEYLKEHENVDLLEFEKNILEIDLGIRYLKRDFDIVYADLIIERDRIKTLLHEMKISFVQSNIDYHYQEKINTTTVKQLKLEKKNNANKIYFLYYLLGGLTIFLIILILFLTVYRKNQQNKSKLRVKENEVTREKLKRQKIQNQQLQAEKDNALAYAQRSAKQLDKHKGLLSRLESVIQEVKNSEDFNAGLRILQSFNNEFKEFLNGVFEEEIITNFKHTQKNKYETLKSKLGNDSSSEFLLAVLYVIGFNTKECSVSLGKSEKAIRSIRYRLRKLLDIDKETDLEKYLDSL